MKKIGIDFGTTNSTIAYFDKGKQQIAGHIFGGVMREYFPSAIAYPKQDGEQILIGEEAQSFYHTSPDDYYYYEFYKLNLCAFYKQVLIEGHGKPVIDVVKDYLHLLIGRYKQERFTIEADQKAKLEYIALAIPNVISENQNIYALEIKNELKTFLDDEADGSEFCSEAVCACEFYISKPENQNFKGNIVVVDYGGGTLDVSNCHVTRSPAGKAVINVVSQRGTSTDERNTFGFAGVAFDRGVVSSIPQIASINLSENELTEYGIEFEQGFKLRYYDAIGKALERFYSDGVDKSLVCKLNGQQYSINISLLHKVFTDVNLPLLQKHFDSVVPHSERGSGGAALQDSFRVLLIGGFSQLLCVKKSIEKFLSIDLAALHDDRIANVNMTEKFIAVAYGSAIYANKRNVEYEPVVSLFEIGVKYFDGKMFNNDILIKENMDIKSIHNIQWGNVYLVMNAGQASVNIYCRTSTSGETISKFDISDACTDNCMIKLGVAVQRNAFTLHIQNMNTNKQVQRDLSVMLADYKNRN